MNGVLKKLLFQSSCSIIIGDRGVGKSCLMGLASREFQKRKVPVYSNYPYKGAYQIPYKTITSKYGDKTILDKEWLYRSDLSNSLVLLDEARTIWNARNYSSWNENDEEFFNFIRKNNTVVILGTQRYDGLDLNIRCAADYTFFMQPCRFLHNFSTVEVSKSCQVKISDKNTQVVTRGYSKNATKVVWDIAEMPVKYTHFYRKPFYNDFDTMFTTGTKEPTELVPWVDF